MIALVGSVFVASLLGSPHCGAMCGGFVCFIAGRDGRASQVAYHAGRLLSYVALGTAAGVLGAAIDRLGNAAGIGRAAAVLAGALMVAWGGVGLARALGARLPRFGTTGLHARIPALLRRTAAMPPWVRALTLGLVTALLPCGWLYAFVATAASTGSGLTGAAVMAVFWSGTVPVLAGVAVFARGALGPAARRLPALTAAALVVIGLLTVAGKFRVAPTAAATSPSPATGHVCH